jgi:hypothetical protein
MSDQVMPEILATIFQNLSVELILINSLPFWLAEANLANRFNSICKQCFLATVQNSTVHT